MKSALPLLLILLCPAMLFGQEFRLYNMLFNAYDDYKEPSLAQRRFSYEDIAPLIEELQRDSLFEMKLAGYSIEGRPINLIRLGNGDTNVLLWSQMHGNESTATMAIFDVFNFFRGDGDSFAYTRRRLLSKLSLYFIPMLNPDGAQNFQRRNALGIDLNRDAIRLITPEAQILKAARDSLNPVFGFNLHDQSVYYSAGNAPNAATISFLAPPYDAAQSINEVRSAAMQLIAYLNSMLQQHIPGGVAKYSDAFEPRAFGDNIQKWGTSTVLIESGGYPDDPEKQFIRKLNFLILLSAFDAIAENRYSGFSTDHYFDIPENESRLTDVLIRNASFSVDSNSYMVDLNIRRETHFLDEDNSYASASIVDFGDLSTQYGYEEIDAEGMNIQPGKIFPDTLANMEEVQKLNFKKLLNQGYTDVVVRQAPSVSYMKNIPVNIIAKLGHANKIALWQSPSLLLMEGDSVRYAVVNGFIYDARLGNTKTIKNALIIR